MEQKKILVVDDEKIIRKLFVQMLGKTYNVTTAESGEEAIEKIKQEKFDVVFIDVIKPGWDGVKTLKAIKEIDQQIPCIIMTGNAVDEKIHEAMQMKVIDYIYKPFGIENIETIFAKFEKQE